jgi:hypothetical protein
MMDYNDVEAILDTLEPKEKIVFGLKYLYHTVKGKLTSDDGVAAEKCLQQALDRQLDKIRTREVGDFQL